MTVENGSFTCNFSPLFKHPDGVWWLTVKRFIGGGVRKNSLRIDKVSKRFQYLDEQFLSADSSKQIFSFNNAFVTVGAGRYCLSTPKAMLTTNSFLGQYDSFNLNLNDVQGKLMYVDGVDELSERFLNKALTVEIDLVVNFVKDEDDTFRFSGQFVLKSLTDGDKKVPRNSGIFKDADDFFSKSKLQSLDLVAEYVEIKPADCYDPKYEIEICAVLFKNGESVFGLRVGRKLDFGKTCFSYSLEIEEALESSKVIKIPKLKSPPANITKLIGSGKLKLCLSTAVNVALGTLSVSCEFKPTNTDDTNKDTDTVIEPLKQWECFGVVLDPSSGPVTLLSKENKALLKHLSDIYLL